MASTVITITDASEGRLIVSVQLVRLADDDPQVMTPAVVAMHAIADGLVETGLAVGYSFAACGE